MDPINVKDLNIPQKFVLYTVGQVEGGVKTDTHLQKLMFLTSKALDIEPKRFGFYPFDYGPFSQMIKEVSEDLIKSGHLSKIGTGVRVNESIDDQIADAEPKSELDQFKIKEIGAFVSGLTRKEVILHTYVRDPEFAKESKILEEVLRDRVSVATGMVKKEKISMTCGAELAGVPVLEFRRMLEKQIEVVY